MPASINTSSRRTTLVPLPVSDKGGKEGRIALGLYRALWHVLSPAVRVALWARAEQGKEDPVRLQERLGRPTLPRPPGTLIWIHGASIGESVAALPLIEQLLLPHQHRHVLVTTGTVSSARVIADRLPEKAFHQFVPIDRRKAVRNFLEHWRPDVALFVESELWPNLLLETRARKIKLALVNARMSERSYQGWLRARRLARRLIGSFDICLAQDAAVADRLKELGARAVQVTGSLKGDAPPLPVDAIALAAFREAARGRPVFLAASTHPGEDELILAVPAALRMQGIDVLTVIAPRHPNRGEAIAQLASSRGFAVARRSVDGLPARDTEIYVADTLGELGLFYRAARVAFLGGSLVPHGGQNPLEAARLGVPVLTGPFTENFAETFEVLLAGQGEGRVTTVDELALQAAFLCGHAETAERMGARARLAADNLSGALARTAAAVETLLTQDARA